MQHVKTGDVLLFSSNTPTSFITKTMVSTEWNHVGIAIRLKKNNEISLDENGKLYVYETNTNERYDDYFKKRIIGAGFSRVKEIFPRYNKISCRPLKEKFRENSLKKLTETFINTYYGYTFPNRMGPFISVWLGLPLSEKYDGEMFCSELTTHYFKMCTSHAFEKKEKNHLKNIFGFFGHLSEDLILPSHYSKFITPKSPIFQNIEYIIYEQHADLIYVLYQPL